MAHPIDAEHDQEDGQGAVATLRPRTAAPAARARPAAQPVSPHPAKDAPKPGRKPIWHKDNFGFWLAVCILISLAFSIAWRALG